MKIRNRSGKKFAAVNWAPPHSSCDELQLWSGWSFWPLLHRYLDLTLFYRTRNRLILLIITMVCCNSASWISRFLEKISFQDQQVFWGFNWSTKTSFAKLASCTLIFLPDCRCDFFAAELETSWNTTWLSNVSFHLSFPDDLQFWSLAGALHLLTQIIMYFSYML